MQHLCAVRRVFFARPKFLIVLFGPFVIAAGCIERPTTIDPCPERPYAGVVLTAAVADPADRELLRQLSRSWSARSGATVRILDTPWDGTADIGFIAPAEMPRWAENGQLATIPMQLRSPTDPYRWDDLLSVYTVRLTNWRERTYALPVLGEGMILAYRLDEFDGIDGRPGNPPATWDELAGLGERYFKGPYLPPLPSSPERLLAEFFTAAACYDRPAVGRLPPGELPSKDFFAFQFEVVTGQSRSGPAASDEGAALPRLDQPAFRHVAELFRRMRDDRCTQDAAAAFRSGEAKVGIISLAELGRIGPEMAARLGVAPIPGARFTFDAKGNKQPTDQETINRVPCLGWGGRVGVVAANCASPAAAWDFLADAGLPERTALDLVASPRWGAGPYRASQLDPRATSRWFGYGLTAIETEHLTTALRDNLGEGVRNYRLRVRTPNEHELATALDEELRSMLKGREPADEAMRRANSRWTGIIRKLPPAAWNELLGKSLGF